MTIPEFISAVTQNITVKTERNSISPGDVGGAFTDLANIVASITGGTVNITAITDDIPDVFKAYFYNYGFTPFNYLDDDNVSQEVNVGDTYTADLAISGSTPHLVLNPAKFYTFTSQTLIDRYSSVYDLLAVPTANFQYYGAQLSTLLNSAINKESLISIETSIPRDLFYIIDIDVQVVKDNTVTDEGLITGIQIQDSAATVVYNYSTSLPNRKSILSANTLYNVVFTADNTLQAIVTGFESDSTTIKSKTKIGNFTADDADNGFYAPINITFSSI